MAWPKVRLGEVLKHRNEFILLDDLSICKQRRIVTYLDNLQVKVDILKRFQTETAAELNALLPSILDKAFKENCDHIR